MQYPLNQLTLIPSHVQQLRRLLGPYPVDSATLKETRKRFEAADLMWLVAGMCSDGDHGVGDDAYHRLYKLYHNTNGTGSDARQLCLQFKAKYDVLAFDVVSTFLSFVRVHDSLYLWTEWLQ